jgi:hypothetical protein
MLVAANTMFIQIPFRQSNTSEMMCSLCYVRLLVLTILLSFSHVHAQEKPAASAQDLAVKLNNPWQA